MESMQWLAVARFLSLPAYNDRTLEIERKTMKQVQFQVAEIVRCHSVAQ